MRTFSFKTCMKKLVLIMALFVGAVQVQAQVYYEDDSDSVSFRDRLFFGGNLSLNVFSQNKFVDVSPLAGYMVSPRYSVGAGLTYQYISREFTAIPSGDRFTLSSSVYGGRVFTRYNVTENYFLYSEFESLNAQFGVGNGLADREWVPGLFIGVGTFQPTFANGGVNVMVLLNVLHDELRSPYNSAVVVRGGFTL